MELPEELYLHILFLADDIDITKKLRGLTKLSLKATEEYHKILLNTKVNIHFNVDKWMISDLNDQQLLQSIKNKEYVCYGRLLCGPDPFDKPVGFKTSIKNLYKIKSLITY